MYWDGRATDLSTNSVEWLFATVHNASNDETCVKNVMTDLLAECLRGYSSERRDVGRESSRVTQCIKCDSYHLVILCETKDVATALVRCDCQVVHGMHDKD